MREKPLFQIDSPKHHVPDGCNSVLDIICLFLDDETMETFVRETNSYAASTNRNVNSRGWQELTQDELWSFFAIVLFLGTLAVRERRLLWDPKSNHYNKWVAETMEVGRFEDILFCLHWTNSAGFSATEKKRKIRMIHFGKLVDLYQD